MADLLSALRLPAEDPDSLLSMAMREELRRRQGELTSYSPGVAERAAAAVSPMFEAMGLNEKDAYQQAAKFTGASGSIAPGDFIPVYGEARDVEDAVRAARMGDYPAAGIMGTAALLGAVPLAGDVASRIARSAADAGRGGRGASEFTPRDLMDPETLRYSEAWLQTKNAPMKRGTYEQWKKYLTSKGVTPDELYFSGFDRAFKGREGKIPKEDLDRYFSGLSNRSSAGDPFRRSHYTAEPLTEPRPWEETVELMEEGGVRSAEDLRLMLTNDYDAWTELVQEERELLDDNILERIAEDDDLIQFNPRERDAGQLRSAVRLYNEDEAVSELKLTEDELEGLFIPGEDPRQSMLPGVGETPILYDRWAPADKLSAKQQEFLEDFEHFLSPEYSDTYYDATKGEFYTEREIIENDRYDHEGTANDLARERLEDMEQDDLIERAERHGLDWDGGDAASAAAVDPMAHIGRGDTEFPQYSLPGPPEYQEHVFTPVFNRPGGPMENIEHPSMGRHFGRDPKQAMHMRTLPGYPLQTGDRGYMFLESQSDVGAGAVKEHKTFRTPEEEDALTPRAALESALIDAINRKTDLQNEIASGMRPELGVPEFPASDPLSSMLSGTLDTPRWRLRASEQPAQRVDPEAIPRFQLQDVVYERPGMYGDMARQIEHGKYQYEIAPSLDEAGREIYEPSGTMQGTGTRLMEDVPAAEYRARRGDVLPTTPQMVGRYLDRNLPIRGTPEEPALPFEKRELDRVMEDLDMLTVEGERMPREDVQQRLVELQDLQRAQGDKLPATPLIPDMKKWTRYQVREALIDAARRGEDYIGFPSAELSHASSGLDVPAAEYRYGKVAPSIMRKELGKVARAEGLPPPEEIPLDWAVPPGRSLKDVAIDTERTGKGFKLDPKLREAILRRGFPLYTLPPALMAGLMDQLGVEDEEQPMSPLFAP